MKDISAVVTRRPAIMTDELTWIAAADRIYVAAEMNAFLVAWLRALRCDVVNRPTPRSLCGPGWSHRHWAMAAAQVGLRWTMDPQGETREVYLVGDRCLNARSAEEEVTLSALAALAGVELMMVKFAKSGAFLVNTRPPLDDPDVSSGLLRYVLSSRA